MKPLKSGTVRVTSVSSCTRHQPTPSTHPKRPINLVFDRADKTLTLCEIKFSDAPASAAVGREFQKLQMFDPGRARRIESVLIAAVGLRRQMFSRA